MAGWSYIAKIVMIGDSGCGKSSLSIRLTDERFSDTHSVTIAAEIGSKILPVGPPQYNPNDTDIPNLSLETEVGNTNSITQTGNKQEKQQYIKLQIWDTAGQEHFHSITRSYFRNAAGCLLVYDVTRRDTFLHVKSWLNELREEASSSICICLVGNKSDLDSNLRQVPYEEAENWAKLNNLIGFIETSAKTGNNVLKAYSNLAQVIYERIKKGDFDVNDKTSGIRSANNDSSMIGLTMESVNDSSSTSSCCLIM